MLEVLANTTMVIIIAIRKNVLLNQQVLPLDFPGGPGVKTLCFRHKERGFNYWPGN